MRYYFLNEFGGHIEVGYFPTESQAEEHAKEISASYFYAE